MRPKDLKRLSPLEKYAIYIGRFDYPHITDMRNHGNAFVPAWYGICSGISAAASELLEPSPVKLKGPSGITVPFGSSDIKALLGFYYDRINPPDGPNLGSICQSNAIENRSNGCKDVNPGAFHLILTNEIGLKKQNFIADLTWGQAIWNHVIFGYSTTVTHKRKPRSERVAPGTKLVAKVVTNITYSNTVHDSWEKIPFDQGESRMRLEYWLDLNAEGRIIGGEWISDRYPDWLWKADLREPIGYFAHLNEIYKKSIGMD